MAGLAALLRRPIPARASLAQLRKAIPALTVLADGTAVHAAPNFDAASVATAHELGYGGDVLAMTRDHDPFHRILSQVLGLIESPALRDAANGNVKTELGGAEEDVILALQRYVQLLRANGQKVHLGKLLKYRDDQPRDSRGRWDAGGGEQQMGGDERGAVQAGSIPRAEPGALSPRGVAVESRFARQLAQSIPAAEAAYAQLKDTAGGKILNTDTVRELSADYRGDRATLSPAVHEPASHFTKLMYERRLAETPVSNTVLFTAGGAGSGKSSGIKDVAAMKSVQDAADVVYDTNMNKFASAKTKIDQALASGRDVQIAYVARDPVESLTHGALPRAMGSGGGRTVPLAEHIATHVGAAKTIQDLAAHYADNPNVQIHYIDNTHGKNGAVLSDASLPSRLNFDNLHERLSSALDAEHAAGRISTPVYHGTKGSH